MPWQGVAIGQRKRGASSGGALSRFPVLARASRTNGESLMISGTLIMCASALGLGFCIGFVWGELKASREIDYALRRNEINELRKLQNSIPGNVRKEVRTPDAN